MTSIRLSGKGGIYNRMTQGKWRGVFSASRNTGINPVYPWRNQSKLNMSRKDNGLFQLELKESAQINKAPPICLLINIFILINNKTLGFFKI